MGTSLFNPLLQKNSRVGKTPGSILGRHHPKKWLSFRSASTGHGPVQPWVPRQGPSSV